ncbi:MAG: hypothetical protein KKA05_10430 [Alphaproteobacteria bacterium]|nr:hypothetical protein [Alphaproteobacteria bacterium]
MNIFETAVSVDLIEDGAWFQPDHPVTSEPFVNGEGQAVRLRLRSDASKAFRDLDERKQRKGIAGIMTGRGKAQRIKGATESARDDRAERFAVLCTGMEGVDGPGLMTPSEQELLQFCADNIGTAAAPRWKLKTGMVWLVDACLDFATDPGNYGSVSAKKADAGAEQPLT